MANNENVSAAPRQITGQEVTGLFLRAPPNAFALFNFLRCIKKPKSSNDIILQFLSIWVFLSHS